MSENSSALLPVQLKQLPVTLPYGSEEEHEVSAMQTVLTRWNARC